MHQVKNDLGRDAVILHTRRFQKGGILGFFSREMVEVMAAADTPAESRRATPQYKSENPPPYAQPASLQLEIANMRTVLEQVVNKIPAADGRSSPFLELLLNNDVDKQIAENLISGLPDDTGSGNGFSMARHLLFERIVNYLQRVDGITVPSTGTKVVALIGPTGVGKTTTIAKLAAEFGIKKDYKVALVTADTYRISAVEQLKTYADIMGVPIDVVYSPDELKAALHKHNDKNLILIDTAGRSPRNSPQIAELRALLQVDPYIETHLVLSATTKYQDALDVVNKFAVCSPQKFLFTKADEASNAGTILNIMYSFPTVLSYVTTGQNVPDEIELADPHKLANMILGN